MTFGALAARYIESVKPGEMEMGPTPGKETVMTAEGVEGRQKVEGEVEIIEMGVNSNDAQRSTTGGLGITKRPRE